jgi:hypothetical protein
VGKADFEQELNLKLFGQMNGRRYVEHNLDGLMRGDLLTRMQAYGRRHQTRPDSPTKCAAREPPAAWPAAGKLHIQGATVPLGSPPPPSQPRPADDPTHPSRLLPMPDLERRGDRRPEIRAAEADTGKVSGYAALFNTPRSTSAASSGGDPAGRLQPNPARRDDVVFLVATTAAG